MPADFNNPLSTQGYLALLASIVENNQAALQFLDGYGGSSNIPTGAKRWNSSASRFEQFDGASWAELVATYAIKVNDSVQLNGQAASYYRNADNLNSGTLPAARFNDTAHGNRGNGSLHGVATTLVNGFMAATDKSKIDGIEPGATADQTDSEILAALLGIDGAGSGLDADYVDGYHAATLLSRSNHTGTQTLSTISDAGSLAAANSVTHSQCVSYSVGDYVERYATRSFNSYDAVYTKGLEFKMFRGGFVRVRIGIAVSTSIIYARIYQNGVAVGTVRSTSSGLVQYFNEDFFVNYGDLIQLYYYSLAGNDKTLVLALCHDTDLFVNAPHYNYAGLPT